MIKRWDNSTERNKQAERLTKYFEDPNMRLNRGKSGKSARRNDPTISRRQAESLKKTYHDNPTLLERKSDAMNKHYADMDNPGLEICGHHIAYDFDRPEAFVVHITRSFHSSIHHPKGQPITEHGYSLID